MRNVRLALATCLVLISVESSAPTGWFHPGEIRAPVAHGRHLRHPQGAPLPTMQRPVRPLAFSGSVWRYDQSNFIAKANFLKIQRICHLLIFRRRIFRLEEAKCVQRLV